MIRSATLISSRKAPQLPTRIITLTCALHKISVVMAVSAAKRPPLMVVKGIPSYCPVYIVYSIKLKFLTGFFIFLTMASALSLGPGTRAYLPTSLGRSCTIFIKSWPVMWTSLRIVVIVYLLAEAKRQESKKQRFYTFCFSASALLCLDRKS